MIQKMCLTGLQQVFFCVSNIYLKHKNVYNIKSKTMCNLLHGSIYNLIFIIYYLPLEEGGTPKYLRSTITF